MTTVPMSSNPEQRALAGAMYFEDFDPDILTELAVQIVAEGGHDTHKLKPQDLLDALADAPTAPWSEIAWGLGELFYGYVGVGETSKREALKYLFCISVMGITCRHNQSNRFKNSAHNILKMMAKSVDPLGCKLDVLALALRNWEIGDLEDSKAKRERRSE